jgi:hypothetical protein
MKEANLPGRCPSCGGGMHVEKLCCDSCGTAVQGHYRPCPVCSLDAEARALFDLFMASRGNLKDVQRSLGVSYPTARQRVEEMFQQLEQPSPRPRALEVLKKLRAGEISVDEAEKLLRGE